MASILSRRQCLNYTHSAMISREVPSVILNKQPKIFYWYIVLSYHLKTIGDNPITLKISLSKIHLFNERYTFHMNSNERKCLWLPWYFQYNVMEGQSREIVTLILCDLFIFIKRPPKFHITFMCWIICRNFKIYFHISSFLVTEMVQVFEIFPYKIQWHDYFVLWPWCPWDGGNIKLHSSPHAILASRHRTTDFR